MRKFIFGFIVGGIVVYLWRKGRLRPQPITSSVAKPDLPPPSATAPETGKLESADLLQAICAPQPDAAQSRYAGTGAPSYQTAPLGDYSPEDQSLAEELFGKAVALVGERAAEKYKGSYSFFANGGTTAAKIIIYQHGLGRENGAFPMLQGGVYVLLRTQRSAPNTLGVAPRHEERFHYHRVNAADLDDAAQEIADVLRLGEFTHA